MYGVIYESPYNERIGQVVKTAQFKSAWSPQDLQPMRLVGGSLRMIGGAERMQDPEDNLYRPRGAMYVSPAPTKYIVPYSVVSYPQFNAVELLEVDKLKSGNHPPLSAGAYSGGKIKISKKVKRDFKKIGRVLKPVGRELLKIGKELGRESLKKGKEMALERLDDYLEGMQEMEGEGFKQDVEKMAKKVGRKGKKDLMKVERALKKSAKEVENALTKTAYQVKDGVVDSAYQVKGAVVGKGVKKDLKKVGKVLKKTFTSKPAKAFYKGLLDVVTPAVALGVSAYTGAPPEVAEVGVGALTNMAKKRIGKGMTPAVYKPEIPNISKPRGRPCKVAGVGIYEGNGAISGAGVISGGASGAKSGGAKKMPKPAGGTDKRKMRGALLKKLMKEKGMTLPEASKYIKENKLM